MRKIYLSITMLLSIISSAFAQLDGGYICKENTTIYSNCDLKSDIGKLHQNKKVFSSGPICTDNFLDLKMIRIFLVEDNKINGWVSYNDLIPNANYKNDSILREIEFAKQEEIRKNTEKLYFERKKKTDSINAEKGKIKYSKALWVLEISAYDYTSQSAGITVVFLNSSKKTIKYINFTVVPYNQVDDIIVDNFGKSSKACQLIGPIVPEEEATFQNDILFFSSVVSYYKLKNISVQYMDNTVVNFNYSAILKKAGLF